MSTAAAYKSLVLQAVFCMLALVLLLRAFVWMQYYLPEFPGLATQDMVTGTAGKPFVNRMLVPQAAALIDQISGDELQFSIGRWGRTLTERFAAIAGMNSPVVLARDDVFFYWRVLTGAVMLGFLTAYGFALYRLADLMLPHSAGPQVAVLLGYFILPMGIWQAAFLYDPATLFFMAWCFYLMLAARWGAYLACFALACMNKETALYILLLFGICNFDRLPARRFWRLLLSQAAIFTAIYIVIRLHNAQAGGGLFEIHWMEYLRSWTTTAAPDYTFGLLAALFILGYGWADKPLMLKRSAWIAGLAVLIWMVFGRMQELRGLYDAYPLFTLLATQGFIAAFRAR